MGNSECCSSYEFNEFRNGLGDHVFVPGVGTCTFGSNSAENWNPEGGNEVSVASTAN